MAELTAVIGHSEPAQVSAQRELIAQGFASRLFSQDATLWGEEATAEASIRLGWTDFEHAATLLFPQIEQLRSHFASQGIDHFVLCGMGGSSLAPAVIARWAGVPLTVLDSTHPDTVLRALADDLQRTAVIVSSKSGSTIETRSQLAAFEHAFAKAGIEPSSRMVIVTDPGSPLDEDSQAKSRHVFHADPNVGGRFSALTAFGLVPAGLAGADVRTLVADAAASRALLASDSLENPALQLASAIAAQLPEIYVLAVRQLPGAEWGLGAWIEQLVAESTGKEGHGVLPIALSASAPEFSGPPQGARIVNIALAKASSIDHHNTAGSTSITASGTLGAQLLLWETVTAALGSLMKINPFDQPDVESAKVAARAALASPQQHDVAEQPEVLPSNLVNALRKSIVPGGYLAIQAYLDPGAAYAPKIAELRDQLARTLGVPVALGWGPSYLHSTGQLHKGGPALGSFVQLIEKNMNTLEIPGSESGFETLIAAQARGDREVLRGHGRTVHVIQANDPATTVAALLAALS